MPSEPLTRDEVARTLADRLDDDLLRDLFPGHAPETIRDLLRGSPARVTAPPDTRPSVPKADAIVRCRLFTDGASRGNPGQAGAGAVLLNERGEELDAAFRLVAEKKLEGIFFLGSNVVGRKADVQQLGIPSVFVTVDASTVRAPGVSSVSVDNRACGRMAVERLIARYRGEPLDC